MPPKKFHLFLFCIAAICSASTAPVANAIDGRLVVAEGSIRPVAPAAKMGPDDPHRPFIARAELKAAEKGAEMRFEVALKMRNFEELKARIARGEIIPYSEMAARYFPTKDDYQAVAAWVTGQGFKITRQDDNHLAIFASSSVDTIQKAMRVNFARVSLEGTEYTSAITAPSVPATIAPLLAGINGLQPHIRAHKNTIARKNSTTGTTQPYTPAQILHPYNASALPLDGTGQTIAIVIDTFPKKSDLNLFYSTYGVSNTGANTTFIQVVSGSLAAPSGEESLDVEWSSSIAPGAKIRVYATKDLTNSDLDAGYQQVYADVVAHPEYGIHQMSMSYGIAETATSAGQVFTDTQYFAMLTAAGVTVFASSGDNANHPFGVSAENPASDPFVTGVGGTTLTLTSGSNINTEVAWKSSGGGTSIYFSRPTWQTGTGVPAGSTRCVPDVAAPADPNQGAYVTLNGSENIFGGTSWSSPTWAGFCALINQGRATANLPPVGLLGPKIYPLNGTPKFHDITSGSNGYPAGTGYDLVTGLGSPDVTKIVTSLTLNQVVPIASLPMVTTLAPGANPTFSVAASGTGSGYTYQWQRMPIGSNTWGNIPASGTYGGVTASSLAIAGVVPEMSGDQFQCIINTGTSTGTTSPPSVLVVDNPLVVTTLAGQPQNAGWANGSGTHAIFAYPSGVAVDGTGNIYVADFVNDTIRKVTPLGVVTNPYGQPGVSGTTDGTGTNALFNQPNSVAIDGSGTIYVADSSNSAIRKIISGAVALLAGRPTKTGTSDGSGTSARFNNPQGVCVDGSGNVYVADSGNNTIRKINSSGVVSTLAGNPGVPGWANGTGTTALFNSPTGVATDSSGNIYVADFYNYCVRKVTPAGVVTTPYGQPGVIGQVDGVGTGALFNAPIGVAVDGSNNVYIADSQLPLTQTGTVAGNEMLRRITPLGVVSTIAGTPLVTGTNDGTGPAAQFDSLQAAVVNSSGVIYLADTYNQTIRAGGLAPLVRTVQGTQTVNAGQAATFSVNAVGSGSLTYQWYYNGNPISSATTSSYSIPSVSAAGNGGTYDVIATDPYGTGTSAIYTLTVITQVPDLSGWMLAALAALFMIAASAFLGPKGTQGEQEHR